MKGELEDVKHTTTTTSPLTPTTMFSPYHHQLHHHQQQCHLSEEEDQEQESHPIKKLKTIQDISTGSAGDGASIEVAKRPRGRPPGSKNKPKPPVIITRESESTMRPHVLEIPVGLDIIDSIARFARQRNTGLCILNASGTVANVSLRQPNSSPGSIVTFPGRFDILSISAVHLPHCSSASSLSNGLTISLAGPQGQIFGGTVVGGLIAAGTVLVVATSFMNPSYHRLPVSLEQDDCQTPDQHQQTQTQTQTPSGSATAGGNGIDNHLTQASVPVSTYSFHLPSDVIWGPAAARPGGVGGAPPPSY